MIVACLNLDLGWFGVLYWIDGELGSVGHHNKEKSPSKVSEADLFGTYSGG